MRFQQLAWCEIAQAFCEFVIDRVCAPSFLQFRIGAISSALQLAREAQGRSTEEIEGIAVRL
jgi:hypothetical protein